MERIANPSAVYTVLLPVDANEERATKAANLVKGLPGDPSELKVVVMNVSGQRRQPWVLETQVPDEHRGEDVDVPGAVDYAAEIPGEYGIQVEKRWEHGDAAEEIVAVANDVDADLVVMCGRKMGPAGKLVFGSVTQSVLRESNRPVTLLVA